MAHTPDHYGVASVKLESSGLKNVWFGVAILGVLATTAVILGTKAKPSRST